MAAKRLRKASEGPYLARSGFQILDPDGRDVIKLAMEHKFSVSAVAAEMGMKVYQFKAAIEEVVGLGAKEFFRHYRAVYTRWMIIDGMALKDISKELGFRYYTHFAAEIRAFYGMSPRSLKSMVEGRTRAEQPPPTTPDD